MCPPLMSSSETEPSEAIFPDHPTLNHILEQQVEAGFPPEFALDLVLQELVMRAVDATGATSAALALARGGDEMICRAATGLHAPDLGVPLNSARWSLRPLASALASRSYASIPSPTRASTPTSHAASAFVPC